MAAIFTLEDGNGVPGANAFIDAQFFKDHHDSRGRDVSSISDPLIQVAIVRATDYIEQRFSTVYRGFRQMKDQGLSWPRLSAFDDDDYLLSEVPAQIQKATAEYALRAHILNELYPDVPRAAPSQDFSDVASVQTGVSQSSGVIKSTSDAVGPLKTAVAYASQAEIQSLLNDRNAMASGLVSGVYIPQYPTADMWLAEVIESGNRTLVRA